MPQNISWNVDPVLIDFGLLQIRWYGLAFATGFVLSYILLKKLYQKENLSVEQLETLFFYVFTGALLGARIVHCFIYDPGYYLSNPLKVLAIWEGGLASHGGVIGIMISIYLYCRKYKEGFLEVLDRIVVVVPVAATMIRIGNFFNSEILGKETDLPWGVIFLNRLDLKAVPHHPAQLYEAVSYFAIFFIMQHIYIREKLNFTGQKLGLFFILCFTTRFLIEFIKIPQESYNSFILNTGQFLSLPFIALGLFLVLKQPIKNGGVTPK